MLKVQGVFEVFMIFLDLSFIYTLSLWLMLDNSRESDAFIYCFCIAFFRASHKISDSLFLSIVFHRSKKVTIDKKTFLQLIIYLKVIISGLCSNIILVFSLIPIDNFELFSFLSIPRQLNAPKTIDKTGHYELLSIAPIFCPRQHSQNISLYKSRAAIIL